MAVETVSISEAHSVTGITKTGAYHSSRNGEYSRGTFSN